jgi:type I restriction-modification system DNA methylase subunit
MVRGKSKNSSSSNSANVGFEAKLWLAADKLRSNMDAAEYKHVVLGLIFLKYISDSFEEHHAKVIAGKGDYAVANPEDPDEYPARRSLSTRVNGAPSSLEKVSDKFWPLKLCILCIN